MDSVDIHRLRNQLWIFLKLHFLSLWMSIEFHGIHGIQWILEPGGDTVKYCPPKKKRNITGLKNQKNSLSGHQDLIPSQINSMDQLDVIDLLQKDLKDMLSSE